MGLTCGRMIVCKGVVNGHVLEETLHVLVEEVLDGIVVEV